MLYFQSRPHHPCIAEEYDVARDRAHVLLYHLVLFDYTIFRIYSYYYLCLLALHNNYTLNYQRGQQKAHRSGLFILLLNQYYWNDRLETAISDT